MTPPEEALSPEANKRLAAIQELSALGSGFRLANMDLEIRGAGNLLGPQQSGNLAAVGFDTFMEMLQDTIDDYRRGLVPLIVPITLLRHHVRRHDVAYLAGQVYLDPHPKELMLRNHV